VEAYRINNDIKAHSTTLRLACKYFGVCIVHTEEEALQMSMFTIKYPARKQHKIKIIEIIDFF
jgi:hypothetical protein